VFLFCYGVFRLRSHAVVEPYVIATHRRLSSLHPISKLLQPHLRYTLEINALARQLLIGADGVIEQCFTPGKYSMEISSAAYKSMWRFDMENLPADLLRRGMAVADPNEPGGLKLVIEDYPYATDGLLIWRAIQDWVTEYVNIYYGGDEHGDALADDTEIHEWWEEIKHCGHADKSHESWWPELKTKEDLISILSNIIWITSAHHAAVNFGQYPYGGYVPNRPAMTRRLIPDQDENNPEYQEFKRNPQKFFLSMLPNKFQTAYVMSVLDSLSTHASDEEYLGDRVHTKWTSDARVIDASKEFSTRVKLVEEVIDQRNVDPRLKNRNGAGVLGYELLRPSSTPGVTARGIPNSISI
jgi:lipoxygenase